MSIKAKHNNESILYVCISSRNRAVFKNGRDIALETSLIAVKINTLRLIYVIPTVVVKYVNGLSYL